MGRPSWVAVIVFLALRAPAGAQARPAGPGTIVGRVLTTSGMALDSADVRIVELKGHVAADAGGLFRFDSIKPGNYTVAARRLGYFPGAREVVLGDVGVVVTIALSPISRSLPTVVTSAARGGLSGIIGDTAFNIISGAQIDIVASGRRAVSDSAGGFYIPLPSGKHMVSIKREGYASKLISVTVPVDSGRRMLVWLSSGSNVSLGREAAIMDSLRQRLMWRSAVYSSLVTREDINRSGVKELTDIARRGATYSIRDDCPAVVDGGPGTMPLWSLHAADIEMVEVYHYRQPQNTVTSIRGGASARRRLPPECETVYVWLRK